MKARLQTRYAMLLAGGLALATATTPLADEAMEGTGTTEAVDTVDTQGVKPESTASTDAETRAESDTEAMSTDSSGTGVAEDSTASTDPADRLKSEDTGADATARGDAATEGTGHEGRTHGPSTHAEARLYGISGGHDSTSDDVATASSAEVSKISPNVSMSAVPNDEWRMEDEWRRGGWNRRAGDSSRLDPDVEAQGRGSGGGDTE